MRRILPNFVAPGTEVFPQGCGPYAALCALHALDPDKYPFDLASLNTIQGDMIARGWWCYVNGQPSGGCNVEHLANYLSKIAGYGVQYFSAYGQGAPLVIDGTADTALHVMLRGQDGSGGGLAGVRPILIEPSDGSALVGNQQVPHVGNHWVTVGGLDSDLGYWVGNGDLMAPNGPTWNGWGTLLASQPVAALVVWDKPTPPPVPVPVPPPDIAGAITNLDGIIASAQDAIKRLEE